LKRLQVLLHWQVIECIVAQKEKIHGLGKPASLAFFANLSAIIFVCSMNLGHLKMDADNEILGAWN